MLCFISCLFMLKLIILYLLSKMKFFDHFLNYFELPAPLLSMAHCDVLPVAYFGYLPWQYHTQLSRCKETPFLFYKTWILDRAKSREAGRYWNFKLTLISLLVSYWFHLKTTLFLGCCFRKCPHFRFWFCTIKWQFLPR